MLGVFPVYRTDVNDFNQLAAYSSFIVVVLQSNEEMQFVRVAAGNWKCHIDRGKVAVMSRRMTDAASPSGIS